MTVRTSSPRQVNLIAGLSALLLLLTVGVVMFMVSGNLSFVDALYLTVVSSSTVGYGNYYFIHIQHTTLCYCYS